MIPINKGRRVRYGKNGEQIVEDFEGYYLTVDEIASICRSYAADLIDGLAKFHDTEWVETKLKEL